MQSRAGGGLRGHEDLRQRSSEIRPQGHDDRGGHHPGRGDRGLPQDLRGRDRRGVPRAGISQGLKKIGDSAFYKCIKLASVVLPDTLETIEDFAFMYCYICK